MVDIIPFFIFHGQCGSHSTLNFRVLLVRETTKGPVRNGLLTHIFDASTGGINHRHINGTNSRWLCKVLKDVRGLRTRTSEEGKR